MKHGEHGGSDTRGKGRFWAMCSVALGATALLLGGTGAGMPGTLEPAGAKFIGASKCKTCHKSEDMGNQFAAWEAGPHAKAFATLATDKAKAIAAEKGIEDPQKAEACLKCHVTAFGVDPKEIKRGFKQEMGVQCESCHGAGEAHMKARLKAASSDDPVPIAEGELSVMANAATCKSCHNEESPTFKPFCFHQRVAEILHVKPGTDTTALLACSCDDSCVCAETCKK